MEDRVLLAYIKDNVLLTQEVCELLNVSKQQVNNLVKQGKLTPIKETANASVFLKADIDEYIAKKRSLPIMERRKIIGDGITRYSMKHFKTITELYEKIEAVHVYFCIKDAIYDGYYSLFDSYQTDTLLRIVAPTCVLVVKDGEKIYYDGFNCGYGGTGPHGTYDMLIELGVEPELAKKVFTSDKLSYYRENGLWQVVDRQEEFSSISSKGMEEEMFVFNNSLVLIPDKTSLGRRELNYLEFLEAYEFFVPHPREVCFYSEEEALKTGHYISNFKNKGIYQVIIKDMSGNEVWLNCPYDETKSISKQLNMESILRKVGFQVPEKEKDSLPQKIKTWLGLNPIIADKIVFHKEIPYSKGK